MALEDVVHIYDCEELLSINNELSAAILRLPDDAFNRRSHFFHGRYENLYVEPAVHPALERILDQALTKAAEILHQAESNLQYGFWLNIMRKGDVTTLHTHDDDEELLSAVYYLQIPEGSAKFRLHYHDDIIDVSPIEGRFMFFNPALPHEVGEHKSDTPRISIGFNFGKKT